MPRNLRATRQATALMAVAALALLAACGGGNTASQAAATSSALNTAAPAASPVAAAGDEVTRAQAIVAKFSVTPTKILATTPLNAPIPRGKSLIWLQCQLPQCLSIGKGIADATAAAGWKTKVISYDSSNPATLVSGMQQALQFKPDVVVNSGLPVALWQTVLPAYAKAGVPIVTMDAGPQDLPEPIIANLYGDQDVTDQGDMVANYFIADSGAKGKALLVDVPSFPVLAAFGQAFKKATTAGCSACSVDTLAATIPQLLSGKLNDLIVSALQKDPSIKYVITVDGDFNATLPSALQAAGLAGMVKIAGAWGTATTAALSKQGKMQAFTGFATEYHGFQAVDAAARKFEGSTVDKAGFGMPQQLLTKDTLQEESDAYNFPKDFREQFKALWKVG